MDLGLKDKVALVTGGSQGIGRAVALQFAAEGVKVALTYRSERSKAEAVVKEIERGGGQALAVAMDLGSLPSIRNAVGAATERFGHVDILVNNAVRWASWLPGKQPRFEEIPPEEWQGMLQDNVAGAVAALQAVVPGMRERRWGRIVNVSSGVALDGVVGMGPYAAAKAGMHGLSAVLARELGPLGILSNIVVPGITVTERVGEHLSAEARTQRGKPYAIGRLLGPEEVAPTIVFLCSAANTAVTGEVVRTSGGKPYPVA